MRTQWGIPGPLFFDATYGADSLILLCH
jgi:hypothetical protein